MEMTRLITKLCTTAPTTMVTATAMISASVTGEMSPKPTVVKTVRTKYMATSHCSKGVWLRSDVPLWSTWRRPTHVSWTSSCMEAQRYQKHERRCKDHMSAVMKDITRTPRRLFTHSHQGLVLDLNVSSFSSRDKRANRTRRERLWILLTRTTLFTPFSLCTSCRMTSTSSSGRQATRSIQKRPRRYFLAMRLRLSISFPLTSL
mmetsp:Transcript_99916/g.308296  ORF Transcript_99916/g.308296 Transcript_99916/m.308296 type:complete len:204 (-) Transcript_99916:472-1083(-)